MTTAAQARAIVERAIPEATKGAKWVILAVGWLESHWGDAWTGDMRGSNNWGAVIGTGTAGGALHADSDPNRRYVTTFARYATPEDAVRAMHALIARRWPAAFRAAEAGRWEDVSPALYGPMPHGPRYYTGTSQDHAVNISRHRMRFLQGLEASGMTLPKGAGAAQSPHSSHWQPAQPLPRLSRGHEGPAVALLQVHVGAEPDGRFGLLTERAVRAWQTDHGIAADGIVGAATWAAIVRRAAT